MQTQVEHIIKELNRFISDTNRARGVSAPLLHTAIHKRHGKGHRLYYKFHWDKLYDGIHATETAWDDGHRQ